MTDDMTDDMVTAAAQQMHLQASAALLERAYRLALALQSAHTDVSVFDVFEGAHVGDGKKSVAIAVTLQPTGKTLTDEEIDKVSASIVAAVVKQSGGVLRA